MSRSGIVYQRPDGVKSGDEICDDFDKYMENVKTHSEKKIYINIYYRKQ
jgi:hypothetical protein